MLIIMHLRWQCDIVFLLNPRQNPQCCIEQQTNIISPMMQEKTKRSAWWAFIVPSDAHVRPITLGQNLDVLSMRQHIHKAIALWSSLELIFGFQSLTWTTSFHCMVRVMNVQCSMAVINGHWSLAPDALSSSIEDAHQSLVPRFCSCLIVGLMRIR